MKHMALNLRQKSSFIFNIQVFILNIMFTIYELFRSKLFLFLQYHTILSSIQVQRSTLRQKSSFIFNIQVFILNVIFTI